MTNTHDTTNLPVANSKSFNFADDDPAAVRKLILSCFEGNQETQDVAKAESWISTALYMMEESDEELEVCAKETPEAYSEMLHGILSTMQLRQRDVEILFQSYSRLKGILTRVENEKDSSSAA